MLGKGEEGRLGAALRHASLFLPPHVLCAISRKGKKGGKKREGEKEESFKVADLPPASRKQRRGDQPLFRLKGGFFYTLSFITSPRCIGVKKGGKKEKKKEE